MSPQFLGIFFSSFVLGFSATYQIEVVRRDRFFSRFSLSNEDVLYLPALLILILKDFIEGPTNNSPNLVLASIIIYKYSCPCADELVSVGGCNNIVLNQSGLLYIHNFNISNFILTFLWAS